jgi:hypothetical protein
MNGYKIPPVLMSGKNYTFNGAGIHLVHPPKGDEQPSKVNEQASKDLPKQEQKKVSKLFSYFKFEILNVYRGKVSNRIFNQRAKACLDCHGLRKHSSDQIGYCGLCGCGMNPRARLTVKLTVAGATCPLNKWQPLKKGKFSFANLMDTGLGISQTLWYNVSRLWKRN